MCDGSVQQRAAKGHPAYGGTPDSSTSTPHPLLDQFDFARTRLVDRMTGPEGDSGNGVTIEIAGMTDDEYLWEPLPNCWSIRPRAAGSAALVGADDAALDMVGRSTYPDGSDPDDPFIETVWWVNQELLHHGAEIALLRDLYRARQG